MENFWINYKKRYHLFKNLCVLCDSLICYDMLYTTFWSVRTTQDAANAVGS